jgi:hypothetical protein
VSITHASWTPRFVLQHGWSISEGRVAFPTEEQMAAGTTAALPSLEIIDHCMTYAKELERIV